MFLLVEHVVHPESTSPLNMNPVTFSCEEKNNEKERGWKHALKIWEQVKKAKLKGCRAKHSNGNLLLSRDSFNCKHHAL